MPELAALLDKAKSKHIFGTKMRSVIQQANPAAIKNVVQQQFEVAGQIIDTGLVPIIEPEVDIHCPQKARAESLLKEAILEKLNGLPAGQQVMLKLTLPEQADFYADCVRHPKVGAGPGPVRRLHAGRGRRPVTQESRGGRELLAGVAGRVVGPSNRCRVQRHAGCLHSENL